jgi:hypothetical protein
MTTKRAAHLELAGQKLNEAMAAFAADAEDKTVWPPIQEARLALADALSVWYSQFLDGPDDGPNARKTGEETNVIDVDAEPFNDAQVPRMGPPNVPKRDIY